MIESLAASKGVLRQMQERDYVVFATHEGYGSITQLFQAMCVDARYVYLRKSNETVVNYRGDLANGEMRQFDDVGWTLVDGKFETHSQL
jgi:hypothetical protein